MVRRHRLMMIILLAVCAVLTVPVPPWQQAAAATGRASWVQQATLRPVDHATDVLFGTSVAVDGATAVVGASGRDNLRGAAYVFVQRGAAWDRQATLVASAGARGDFFGNAVAISADTAVVGALASATNRGTAYVFVRHGTTWSGQARLVPPDAAAGDFLGYAVAIDGQTIVVGASDKHNRSGVAYVFVRHRTIWAQQARLTIPGLLAGAQFGRSVAISGDIVVVGAPGQGGQGGAAYVFARHGATWSPGTALTVNGRNPAGFGGAVAASGTTVLVGAYASGGYVGAAYAFVRQANAWRRQATLAVPHGTVGTALGSAVAIQGNTAVLGAPGQGNHRGGAYVLTRRGATWSWQTVLSAAGGKPGDDFGAAVALGDGTVVVGARITNDYAGAAYVFGGPAGAMPRGPLGSSAQQDGASATKSVDRRGQ